MENKLQVLTKEVVTYKPIEVRSYNFRHCTHHEQGNGWLGEVFLYSSFFTAFEGRIHEKNWSRTIVSTWCKQAPITYESLGVLQRNRDFLTPLEQANKMMSRLLSLRSSFTKKETFKKFMNFFFNNTQICTQCSMLYTANLGLCDYVLFLQIRSHMLRGAPILPAKKLEK